jgi:hypothetical protein
MKKDYLKKFICLFFVVLFSFKGIISVCPALSAKAAEIESIEIFDSEKTGSNKNAEDGNEKEIKDSFLTNNGYYNIEYSSGILINTNIAATNIAHKQEVFLPVTTPPPEEV